jgi:CRISPR-associated protein Cas5d
VAYGIKLHCWGDFALFTRPEMKVERVSYDVVTPSSARGIIEAIYWKPEMRWVIDRFRVLKPVRFTSQRRNEVGAKIPAGAARLAMKAGSGNLGMYIEVERQQRAALLLRDVGYLIEAHIEITGGEDNIGKHLDQFNRRARGGQCFARPYLGTRECAADFALIEENTTPPADELPAEQRNRDLGWMLHDIDYANDRQPRFFKADVVDGVISVPRFHSAEVRG